MAEQRTSNDRLCEDELQIIQGHAHPYGIRDRSGFLFFFRSVHKFDDQEGRYRRDLAQMQRLAEFLLSALRAAHEPATAQECQHDITRRDHTIEYGEPPFCTHCEQVTQLTKWPAPPPSDELERYKRALYQANGRLMMLYQEPVKLEYSATSTK